MDIKLRYTWQKHSDGSIWQEVVDIKIIEARIRLSKSFNYNKLIARDLFTGEKDQDGNDIYENSNVEFEMYETSTGSWHHCRERVQFSSGRFEPLPGYNKRNYKIVESSSKTP